MSKRTKKSVMDKSVSSGIMYREPMPPAVLVTVPEIPSDPAEVPFPEWNDHEVNGEKWDVVKAKTSARFSHFKANVAAQTSQSS